MNALLHAPRLNPASCSSPQYACLQRATHAAHLSSSRQQSEAQLRQKFCLVSSSRRQHICTVSAQSSNGAVARPWGEKNARLVLEDGSVWEGRAFGAEGTALAETVFNTSLTGYQEILTDPSYKGQYVVFTHPHIGNVGINFGEQSPTATFRYNLNAWSDTWLHHVNKRMIPTSHTCRALPGSMALCE